MKPFKYDVSLRITHPSLDADEICDQLGLQAYRKWTVGEQRKTPTGDSLEGNDKLTYCCFHLEGPKRDELCDFLSDWNKKLHPQKAFFERIRSTGGSLEYFIGMYFEE